jgi:uncharacterized membrane protein
LKNYFKIYITGLFFIYAGIAHFTNPDFYLELMPSYLPFHKFLVDSSGVLEIIGGTLLFFNKARPIGVYILNLLLISFFIIHVDMFFNFQFLENFYLNKLAMTIRLILQILLIYFINSLKKINF